MKIKMKNIKKYKKIIIIFSALIITVLVLFFTVIKPNKIKKQCSIKTDSSSYINPEYNENKERLKQKMLLEYIDCRNNNLVDEDQFYMKIEGSSPYKFTQEQYNNSSIDELYNVYLNYKHNGDLQKIEGEKQLSKVFGYKFDLEKLNQLTLGKTSPLFYLAYNGFIIDIPTFQELKKSKDKYQMCNFPDDFIEYKLTSYSTRKATDKEYKECLVSNGLMNKEDLKNTFYGYECQTSDCEGHKAGYKWAKDKGITEYEDCGGKSNSFIEGCKSYVSGEYNFGNNE